MQPYKEFYICPTNSNGLTTQCPWCRWISPYGIQVIIPTVLCKKNANEIRYFSMIIKEISSATIFRTKFDEFSTGLLF